MSLLSLLPGPLPRIQGNVSLGNAVLILFALSLAGCASLGPPPITDPATAHRSPGRVVWHDLLAEDTDTLTPFYTRLFHWTAQKDGRYTLLMREGTPLATLVEVPSQDEKPVVARWLPSFSVRDVDRVAQVIAAEGGKVLEPPRDLPRRGRFALVSDPQGAQLVLLTSKTGDPQERPPALNGWLWDELWTQDGERSLAFYRALGGYQARKVRPGYWILSKDGHPLAGVRELRRKDLESRWVPVVRVADPTEVQQRAVALGGTLLVGTDEPPSDGTVALIADPAGALLMIQRWQPEDWEGQP